MPNSQYKRRSVNFSPFEVEAVMSLLDARIADAPSEKDRHFHTELARKVIGTPCFDNPIVLGSKDLFDIISSTKSKFIEWPSDLYLSSKKLTQEEISKLALASSFVMWLNQQGNLRRIVDFDLTDMSYEFEALGEE